LSGSVIVIEKIRPTSRIQSAFCRHTAM